MRRVSAAWAALTLAAVGVVVMTAGPAFAQASCTGPQTASQAGVSTGSVLPGESLTLNGSGFAANQILGVGLFRPPMVLASVASDIHGFYTATIQIPPGTPSGQNEITVFGNGPLGTCHQSLALFTVRELPVPVTVTLVFPPPTYVVYATTVPTPIVVQQPLARTGTSSPALVAAGLVALLLGFHVVRVGRGRPITG